MRRSERVWRGFWEDRDGRSSLRGCKALLLDRVQARILHIAPPYISAQHDGDMNL